MNKEDMNLEKSGGYFGGFGGEKEERNSVIKL